jgi:hypothetical protein
LLFSPPRYITSASEDNCFECFLCAMMDINSATMRILSKKFSIVRRRREEEEEEEEEERGAFGRRPFRIFELPFPLKF